MANKAVLFGVVCLSALVGCQTDEVKPERAVPYGISAPLPSPRAPVIEVTKSPPPKDLQAELAEIQHTLRVTRDRSILPPGTPHE